MQQMRRLSKNERHEKILHVSARAPYVRISSLARQLGVSTETVRRDLQELCGSGLMERTYGGAVAPPMAPAAVNGQPAAGIDGGAPAVAAAVVQRVRPGETVMLGGGRIMLPTAREIARCSVNLTVITCNARIAAVLGGNPTIRAVLSPGDYNPKEDEVTGSDTVAYLEQFRADLAIVEAVGLTKDGLYESSFAVAAVKRAMLRQSDRRIAVAGEGAWSRSAVRRVCTLGELDEIVSPEAPDETITQALGKVQTALSVV